MIKAYYLNLMTSSAPVIGNLATSFPNAEAVWPRCECCDRPMNLLFQFSLQHLLGASERFLRGFQCTKVDEGGDPAVFAQIGSDRLHLAKGALPVRAEEREETSAPISLNSSELDPRAESKLLGAFVRGGPEWIPKCRKCGSRMSLLLQLAEDPVDYNFGGRDLLVFYCEHESDLTTATEFF